MKKTIWALLFVLFMVNHSFAAKEGILPLSRFHIESVGIGDSGKIVVDGQQNERSQISHLTVHAFGKVYVVPQKNLDQLTEMTINGIQLSYTHGYKELGGREIYIQFQKGFTSGSVAQATLIINENGEIRLL